jgi:hypothetical protein
MAGIRKYQEGEELRTELENWLPVVCFTHILARNNIIT